MPPALQLLVIVIALIGFWAIAMRPARMQQRRVAELQSALAVGDEVIISAGIFGTVVAIEDDKVRLEITPGTVITVARQVVVRRAPEPEQEQGPVSGLASGPVSGHADDAVPGTAPDRTIEDAEEKQDRG